MNAETFCEHFATFADAPNGVARLRQMVMQLAIQGRLVPQDTKEKPADSLIADIAKFKAAATGRETQIVELDATAAGFPLPSGWAAVAFGDIMLNRDGERIPVSRDIRDGRKGPYDYYGASGVIDSIDDFLFDKSLLLIGEDGANLINRSTPIAFIAHGKYWVNNHAHVLDGISLEFLKYIELYINAIDLKPYVTGTAQPKMNQAKMNSIVVALPPLAEQRRIVEKVDQLLGLCDELAARQAAQREKRQRLVGATLDRLVSPQTSRHLACRGGLTASAPFDENTTGAKANEPPGQARWRVMQDDAHRLRNHFDQLFDTPTTIPQLRQTILQLAVQGKLVPQDPSEVPTDVPASSSLAASKRDRDIPFEIPANWKWMKLGQVSELINGDRSKNYPNRAEYVPEGVAWINTGHIEPDGTLSTESMHFITRKKFDSLRSGKVRLGDLVYCLRGATLGKTAIISQYEEGAVASSLVIIRLHPAVVPRFAYHVLTSPLGRAQIFQFDNGSAQPNLSANSVKKYWIPLPPPAEQKRIVTKVTELLSLCDALEAKLTQAESASTQLLSAAVHHLLQKP
jgi:type I restriction enzyme S subunit